MFTCSVDRANSVWRWLLPIMLVSLLGACRRVPTGAGVTFENEPAPGLITVSATGRGTGLMAIEQNAIQAAFETLLFVGFPVSTSARLPMTDVQSVAPGFVPEWVQQGRYQPFVSRINRAGGNRQRASGGGKTIRYTLTINQEALRRSFEQQGIIRKLGY